MCAEISWLVFKATLNLPQGGRKQQCDTCGQPLEASSASSSWRLLCPSLCCWQDLELRLEAEGPVEGLDLFDSVNTESECRLQPGIVGSPSPTDAPGTSWPLVQQWPVLLPCSGSDESHGTCSSTRVLSRHVMSFSFAWTPFSHAWMCGNTRLQLNTDL